MHNRTTNTHTHSTSLPSQSPSAPFSFPPSCSFARGGDRCVFDRFWTTNSIPTVTDQLPEDDVFSVLDLMDKVSDACHHPH